jgi:uncharacterized protein
MFPKQEQERQKLQHPLIKVGEGSGGGIMKQTPEGPSGWLAYVLVDIQSRMNEKVSPLTSQAMAKDRTEPDSSQNTGL